MNVGVSPDWLALRESADAAARARDLVQTLERALSAGRSLTIHDLGCGTGAMGRWLAPMLPGAQHWIAHDHDPQLLTLVSAHPPALAADGAPVTVEARRTDLAQLRPRDVAGASLITASALLDVLTADEVARLVDICAGARCPVLLTLSVTGHVEIAPADPLDDRVSAAFNDHQRRRTARGSLLGPDAAAFAADAFTRGGAEVMLRPSPWCLGRAHTGLIAEWFAGWIGAACEQRPELAAEGEPYTRRRRAQLEGGNLGARVDHVDMLVLP